MEFRRVLFRSKGMAGKACHAFGSTTQFGLTQALGLMFNFSNFVPKEPNLARAGGLLLIEIVTFVSVSFALSGLGVEVEGPIFASLRSEERRVGKECVSTCRSRWSTYSSK